MIINKVMWWDINHQVINVINATDDENHIYNYVANATDPAPMNQKLWALAMKKPETIEEPDLIKMARGEMEIPLELVMLTDGEIILAETVRQRELAQVEMELQKVVYPNPIDKIKIERDPALAAERDNTIDALWHLHNELSGRFPDKELLTRFSDVGVTAMITDTVVEMAVSKRPDTNTKVAL